MSVVGFDVGNDASCVAIARKVRVLLSCQLLPICSRLLRGDHALQLMGMADIIFKPQSGLRASRFAPFCSCLQLTMYCFCNLPLVVALDLLGDLPRHSAC